MEAAGLCVHQRGIAAAIPVHPGLGLGGDGWCGPGVLRLGAHFNMQEVKACACGWSVSGCPNSWAESSGKSLASGGHNLSAAALSFQCTSSLGG